MKGCSLGLEQMEGLDLNVSQLYSCLALWMFTSGFSHQPPCKKIVVSKRPYENKGATCKILDAAASFLYFISAADPTTTAPAHQDITICANKGANNPLDYAAEQNHCPLTFVQGSKSLRQAPTKAHVWKQYCSTSSKFSEMKLGLSQQNTDPSLLFVILYSVQPADCSNW